MANTVINTPELLNLDSTTGATILAKGTISERPSIPTFNADYLIIAGGGGGGGGRGGNATVWSAGGGGGGYQYSTGIKLLIDTNYTITVGAGGAGGTGNGTPISSDGENSSIVASGIINEVATGGIGGGKSQSGAGGASGSLPSNSGGTSYSAGAYWGGGGGAGIGSNGSNGSSSSGGAGGNGLQFSITGTATYYSGGGGGGIYQLNNGGSGGLGGGGNGKGTTANGDNGLVNTGGGGGAAGSTGGSAGVNFTGGTGGSGIVILRYPNSYTINIGAGLTSSTITDGSEKVTSFTAGAGTITFSGATSSNLDEYPIDGTLRFNTETNKTEYYDGTGWYEIVDEYASGFIGPATNYFDTKLYTGNGATQSIGGYINGSASFNGSSSKIESDVLQSTNMTFSFWFKTTTTGEREYLMGFNTSGSAGYISTRLNANDTIGIAYWNGSTYAAVSSSAITRDTDYNHICITISGTSYTIYYNGSSIGSGTLSGFSASSRTDFVMGFDAPTGATSYMNGSLDQVRIYDTALSSSDVTALYSETAATATTAAFPSGQTAIATYTMDTSANGLLNTQDLSTVNYPVGAGCLALYEMNGNSNDTSGTYNGTPTNITYQGGAFDQAAVFNGSSSRIDNSSISSQVLNDYTISFWAKWNSTPTAQEGLMGIYQPSTSNGTTMSFANGNFLINPGNSQNAINLSPGFFSPNQWYHIALTHIDGGNVILYVNSNVEGTLSNVNNTINSSSLLRLGLSSRTSSGSYNYNQYFNGSIDQVRIFDTALTQAQVTTLARGIATSYSGAATNVNFNGHLDFAPDFVWVKNRTVAVNHYLYDSIRGTGPAKALHSNTTASEASASTYSVNGGIQSIDTNGFTAFAGTDTTYQGTNKSGNDYVSWNWKAGGAAVTNNDGTIASQVSANKDAGFSIVKWTGDANSSSTIGHGLTPNNQPMLVIMKDLDSSNDWMVITNNLWSNPTAYYLKLNLTNALATGTGNPYLVNNTVFKNTNRNISLNDYIAYCWHSVAGYSKMGSYSGTGVSGKEVALDFNPSFVLIKRTNASTGWVIVDDKRGTKELYPNLSNAEDTTTTSIVLGTNKFTLNTTGSWYNASGGNYLYMAFA